jgi:vacuolar iron transporter family protein
VAIHVFRERTKKIDFTSRVGSSKLVIIGGLAEIFSGMLSMGLGEYLSSNTKAKQWDIEYAREKREVREMPHEEEEEIFEIFDEYDIPRESVIPIVEALKRDPTKWVDVSLIVNLTPVPNLTQCSS